MENWKDTNLASLYWFQEGPGVRNWQFKTSGIKLLNVSNITTTNTIDLKKSSIYLSEEEVEKIYSHFLLDEGDLVIASSGISFDIDKLLRTKIAFVSEKHLPLCLNTSTMRFKAKDENSASLNFLRYWLESEPFRVQITKLVTGSAQQNFGSSHLKQLQISLPSPNDQRRIAAILDKADRLRRQRRFAQTLSDSLLQSVFIKMFGNLQEENNWKWDKLGAQSAIASGVTKGQNFNGKKPVLVPYLRVANVQDGYLDLSEIKIIEALESEAKSLKLKHGDILMTEGGDYDKLGRGTIWDAKIENCIHQNHIFRVRLNKESIIPKFFDIFLRSRFTKSYFLRCAKQTTNLATINMTQLKELPVPLVPLSLQEQFTEIVRKFERVRRQQREASRQSEHLFQTLLHRAFRGEL